MPMAFTSSSTERLETPCIQASWIIASGDFWALLRGFRNAGK